MSSGPPLLINVLAHCVSAANRAGGIIREVMAKGELGIVSKGKNDLQTEADRSAESSIVASLSAKFPDLKIVGEEGLPNKQVPSDWISSTPDSSILTKNYTEDLPRPNIPDIVVWVDPLDGTSEYTQGLLDHVTVLIGLAVNGQPVGGLIHQPYFKDNNGSLGRTIWGLKGVGVGGFVPGVPPSDKLFITTTRSHSNEVVESTLNSLKPDEIIRVGGSGYKVLLLLEGKAHAYVFASPGCKKWDTCGPEAVLSCYGGILTDIYGVKYSYLKDVDVKNSTGVLASADINLHNKLKAAILKSGVKI